MNEASNQPKTATQLLENVSESTVACLITMVQGNVLALGLSHWIIASQTGILAGSIAAVAMFLSPINSRWLIAVILGIATAAVDFFVHEGMFGPVFAEAAVTGLGAALLSYFVGWLWTTLKNRKAAEQVLLNEENPADN